MKKIIKKLLSFIGFTFFVLLLVFGVFLIYSGATEYVPDTIEKAETKIVNKREAQDSVFSFVTWNIGFCGLGEDMDFFYDGGAMVRPTEKQNEKFFQGVRTFLGTLDSLDFLLLQEVDVNSKRSYYHNQKTELSNYLDAYNAVFVKNYDTWMVPSPLTNPLGKIEAGMMTFSKFKPYDSKRYALPQVYEWPKKLFLLDRAFIYSRFPLKNGKNLVVVNVHNSAYVHDEVERKKELNVIKELVEQEYEAGNYVVIGGDWNMNPPGYTKFLIDKSYKPVHSEFTMDENMFGLDWKWSYDPVRPTNRSNEVPFEKGVNETTLIDYYLLSPNVDILEVKTLSQDFKYSDHEAVYLKVVLK